MRSWTWWLMSTASAVRRSIVLRPTARAPTSTHMTASPAHGTTTRAGASAGPIASSATSALPARSSAARRRSIGCFARARSSEAGRIPFFKRPPRAAMGINDITYIAGTSQLLSRQQARAHGTGDLLLSPYTTGKRPGAPSIGIYICDLLTDRQRWDFASLFSLDGMY